MDSLDRSVPNSDNVRIFVPTQGTVSAQLYKGNMDSWDRSAPYSDILRTFDDIDVCTCAMLQCDQDYDVATQSSFHGNMIYIEDV